MKTRLVFPILILSLLFSFHAAANIVFYADFEPGSKDAKPNADVNNVKNYKPENAGTIWADGDFNGGKIGGKGAMAQTAEGCGISGNTPLPGVDDFTDGIIQVVFSFGDDDSFGVQFRRKGDDKGYLVVFGYNETSKVILGDLADGCCPSGQCLDQCGCENGGKEILGVDHGLGEGSPRTTPFPILDALKSKAITSRSGTWNSRKSKICSQIPVPSVILSLNPTKPRTKVLVPSGSGTKVGVMAESTVSSSQVRLDLMLMSKTNSQLCGARLRPLTNNPSCHFVA